MTLARVQPLRVAVDKRVNFVPVATLSGNLGELALAIGCQTQDGSDDLDYYSALDLQLDNTFPFELIKYRGTPENTMELFFASRLSNWRELLDEIVKSLELTPDRLLWTNEDYDRLP